jgi:hypothetical protein
MCFNELLRGRSKISRSWKKLRVKLKRGALVYTGWMTMNARRYEQG